MIDAVDSKCSEGENAPERVLHWLVECPEAQGLAEADISARAAPFAMSCIPRLTVKNCSFWPERVACRRACLSSRPQPE